MRPLTRPRTNSVPHLGPHPVTALRRGRDPRGMMAWPPLMFALIFVLGLLTLLLEPPLTPLTSPAERDAHTYLRVVDQKARGTAVAAGSTNTAAYLTAAAAAMPPDAGTFRAWPDAGIVTLTRGGTCWQLTVDPAGAAGFVNGYCQDRFLTVPTMSTNQNNPGANAQWELIWRLDSTAARTLYVALPYGTQSTGPSVVKTSSNGQSFPAIGTVRQVSTARSVDGRPIWEIRLTEVGAVPAGYWILVRFSGVTNPTADGVYPVMFGSSPADLNGATLTESRLEASNLLANSQATTITID